MFECFLAEGKKIGVLFVVVFRGKVSEGMDFVDNYVRVVIIVRYNGFSENLNLLYYCKGKIIKMIFKILEDLVIILLSIKFYVL